MSGKDSLRCGAVGLQVAFPGEQLSPVPAPARPTAMGVELSPAQPRWKAKAEEA